METGHRENSSSVPGANKGRTAAPGKVIDWVGIEKKPYCGKRAALDSIMKAQGWNKSDVGTAENPLVIRDMTDAERAVRMAGKAPQNEWGVQVTPTTKNLDGSTTQGNVYRFNKATGETSRVDEGQGNAGQAPAKDNMIRGQVYQTRGGPMRWNGSSFERVG
jgi:hypothetical protein